MACLRQMESVCIIIINHPFFFLEGHDAWSTVHSRSHVSSTYLPFQNLFLLFPFFFPSFHSPIPQIEVSQLYPQKTTDHISLPSKKEKYPQTPHPTIKQVSHPLQKQRSPSPSHRGPSIPPSPHPRLTRVLMASPLEETYKEALPPPALALQSMPSCACCDNERTEPRLWESL